MQQLLQSWLLVGILLLPATQVGIIQALIGLPGIFLMLLGGASADRTDARGLLIRVYSIAWLFPLALFAATEYGWLNIWSVSLFGVCMSTAISFSNPAQQAILNRIVRGDVQRGVTAATAVTFLVQLFGFYLAGQMEVVGVGEVLLIQSVSLVFGAIAVTRIAPLENQIVATESTYKILLAGFRSAYDNKMIRNVVTITFISGVFNAGAFMTALPFIVKRVYEGNALSLATIMIVFYAGATISNVIQFKIMPLARPGFWFLVMQLSRVFLLALVWLEPNWWLLMGVMFVWGLNMGVTTNLSRAIIQEAAEPAYLGRVLSVYSLGMTGSMPIGALVVGFVIDAYGTMNAMIPAMIASLLLCIYGFLFTDVGRYRSPNSGSSD
jgi:MFS family permease